MATSRSESVLRCPEVHYITRTVSALPSCAFWLEILAHDHLAEHSTCQESESMRNIFFAIIAPSCAQALLLSGLHREGWLLQSSCSQRTAKCHRCHPWCLPASGCSEASAYAGQALTLPARCLNTFERLPDCVKVSRRPGIQRYLPVMHPVHAPGKSPPGRLLVQCEHA